jgi:hypothetical protein
MTTEEAVRRILQSELSNDYDSKKEACMALRLALLNGEKLPGDKIFREFNIKGDDDFFAGDSDTYMVWNEKGYFMAVVNHYNDYPISTHPFPISE